MKQSSNSDPALGIIPSILNAIGSVGDSMPLSFVIPAPKSKLTGAVQAAITRKEQVQRTILHGLPTGIKEGLATRSAHGFALGALSGAISYDAKHHRSNMDEIRAEFRNASEHGTITIANPLSFYVPKNTREAVSTLLTHLVDNRSFFVSMDQAGQIYNEIQATRSMKSSNEEQGAINYDPKEKK